MSSPPPAYSSPGKEADPYYLHTSQTSQTSKLVSKIENSASIPIDHVPPQLERATMRLEFPPSYVVVGAYRLISDGSLRGPIWNKCKHGVVRGGAVGLGWVSILSDGRGQGADVVVCCEWLNFVGAVYVQNTEEVCKVVHVEVSGKYNYFRSWDADVLNSCSLALRGSLVSRTTPSSDTNSPSTSPHVRLSLFLPL